MARMPERTISSLLSRELLLERIEFALQAIAAFIGGKACGEFFRIWIPAIESVAGFAQCFRAVDSFFQTGELSER